MTTSQTATGHQQMARSRKDGMRVLRRRLLDTIVGRFARDHHVVNVALTQSGPADPHEAGVLLQLWDSTAADVSHAAFYAADELISDHADSTAIRHAPFDAFGHQLGKPVAFGGIVGEHLHGSVVVGGLEVAFAGALRHGS